MMLYLAPWPVLLVGYLLSFVTIVYLVLERREPTATLAWALGIVLVPYLGILAYLMIGRHRFVRRVRQRRRRAHVIEPHLVELERGIEAFSATQASASLTKPAYHELVGLTSRIGLREPTCGNRVQLFGDGPTTYDSLERAIAEARQHVHMEYYIFEEDQTGRRFRDLLTSKAREGVQVRVLVDGVGSFGLEGFMAPLVDAGGELAAFLPVSFAWWPRVNLRNHRKIAVIDGRVAFTGGVNIGDEYTGRKGGRDPWRDTHLRIEGPAVYHLQEVFAEDWHFATDQDRMEESWFPDQGQAGDVMVQVVASGPDTDTSPIRSILFAAINSAKKRAFLTTPYFVPDQAMLMALETAALRGVDVRLLLPSRSDLPLVMYAGRSYYDELLRSGVRIFEYHGGILHAKTLVVDDTWATVGSANMDIRSFQLNFELNVAIYGAHYANNLGEVFERDLGNAREAKRGDASRVRLSRRIPESMARILSPVL